MKSFEVITNEYLNNEETPGQYLLSMKIVDTNNETHEINRMIRVFNESELPKENEEPKAKNNMAKIADFFIWIFNNIILPVWKVIVWI
ncbi:hypothetical protein, partial [Haploplasma axanthum]|uniref:hypothetical protein n=1 Tax=Haploplasma axanthum TaxID=29552 RepID=UPI001E5DA7F9